MYWIVVGSGKRYYGATHLFGGKRYTGGHRTPGARLLQYGGDSEDRPDDAQMRFKMAAGTARLIPNVPRLAGPPQTEQVSVARDPKTGVSLLTGANGRVITTLPEALLNKGATALYAAEAGAMPGPVAPTASSTSTDTTAQVEFLPEPVGLPVRLPESTSNPPEPLADPAAGKKPMRARQEYRPSPLSAGASPGLLTPTPVVAPDEQSSRRRDAQPEGAQPEGAPTQPNPPVQSAQPFQLDRQRDETTLINNIITISQGNIDVAREEAEAAGLSKTARYRLQSMMENAACSSDEANDEANKRDEGATSKQLSTLEVEYGFAFSDQVSLDTAPATKTERASRGRLIMEELDQIRPGKETSVLDELIKLAQNSMKSSTEDKKKLTDPVYSYINDGLSGGMDQRYTFVTKRQVEAAIARIIAARVDARRRPKLLDSTTAPRTAVRYRQRPRAP